MSIASTTRNRLCGAAAIAALTLGISAPAAPAATPTTCDEAMAALTADQAALQRDRRAVRKETTAVKKARTAVKKASARKKPAARKRLKRAEARLRKAKAKQRATQRKLDRDKQASAELCTPGY